MQLMGKLTLPKLNFPEKIVLPTYEITSLSALRNFATVSGSFSGNPPSLATSSCLQSSFLQTGLKFFAKERISYMRTSLDQLSSQVSKQSWNSSSSSSSTSAICSSLMESDLLILPELITQEVATKLLKTSQLSFAISAFPTSNSIPMVFGLTSNS